ncbi:SfnB family sulfur acquisition oxidoreductase [uncultured Leifsonia sp.]|uniref:SfnB family sulfur acquisition oxidoreductase n=1 Tax=Leifsonia sp. TaxID=1870902 RepID=UPI0028D73285|nr:SfnB family sulfur acquisition oxidoreductase [uncultured Leifsonia sp.]
MASDTAVTSAPPRVRVIASDAEARAVARDFAESVRPYAAQIDAERRIPDEVVDAFSGSGLWAITVPRAFGGAEVSHATLADVIATVSAVEPSLGQIPQNHFCLVEDIRLSGTAQQQAFFFDLVLGGARFANAFSEAGGKTVAEIQTRLVSDGEDVVVTGRKFYSTGSAYAHWIPVLAVDEDGLEKLVFAERGSDGLTVVDDWSAFGQRATSSGTVLLEGLRVPADRVFPMHTEYENPTIAGPFAQLTTLAIDLGIARGAIRETHDAVRAARPWIDSGVDSASKDPLTLERVGRLDIDLAAAEALTEKAGQAVDAAKPAADEQNVAAASIAVARAKVLTTELALEASSRLLELGGTRSTLGAKALDRYWRNARVHTLHDPVRWKPVIVGDYVLNGTLPARHSWI